MKKVQFMTVSLLSCCLYRPWTSEMDLFVFATTRQWQVTCCAQYHGNVSMHSFHLGCVYRSPCVRTTSRLQKRRSKSSQTTWGRSSGLWGTRWAVNHIYKDPGGQTVCRFFDLVVAINSKCLQRFWSKCFHQCHCLPGKCKAITVLSLLALPALLISLVLAIILCNHIVIGLAGGPTHTSIHIHYLILQLTKAFMAHLLWPCHPHNAQSLHQITYVDFVFYELLDQHRLFESTLLDDFTNIKVMTAAVWWSQSHF